MLNKMRYFLKNRGLKVKDLVPVTIYEVGSETAEESSNAGLSIFSWVLIALVCVGVIFAIVKIAKVSKKKKTAQG